MNSTKIVLYLIINIILFSFLPVFSAESISTNTVSATISKIGNNLISSKDFEEAKLEDTLKLDSKSSTTKALILTFHNVRDYTKKDSLFAKEFITPVPILEKYNMHATFLSTLMQSVN